MHKDILEPRVQGLEFGRKEAFNMEERDGGPVFWKQGL